MLLETFYKDCIKTLCTGAHKRTQIHCSLWTKFLVNEIWYICTKHNEIHKQEIPSIDRNVLEFFCLPLYTKF